MEIECCRTPLWLMKTFGITMKKIIILLGISTLLLAALYIHRILPWTPSHAADYFMSESYKSEFNTLGMESSRANGGKSRGTSGASIDYVYILDGNRDLIGKAIERTREHVRALLTQDKANISGASSGSDIFSFQYAASGRYGYCTIRAFPNPETTKLVIIFFERK
jgi:hypothetical protein